MIEFQYKYCRKHTILLIKSLRRKISLDISWKNWTNPMTEMNEKPYRILISLMFHHPRKKIGTQTKKILRGPHVLIKHITLNNFFKEILARKDFFFIFRETFWKKVNEKACVILISLIFDQNFEWEIGTKNLRLIWRCSFCYTGFTELYVLLTLGDRERVRSRIES